MPEPPRGRSARSKAGPGGPMPEPERDPGVDRLARADAPSKGRPLAKPVSAMWRR